MQRVERHIILGDKNINHLCFLSKNLYNYCNYILRQLYLSNLDAISEYKDLIKEFKIKDKVFHKIDEFSLINRLIRDNQKDYRSLPSQTSQQAVLLLYKNWKSFFKSIKVAKEKELRPAIPYYKHKEKGRNVIVFTNQQVKLKNGFIYFPKATNIRPVKTKVNNICQVRIVPQATCYVLEVIYNKEVASVKTVEDTYLSIDVGVNNLSTCVNNIGQKPFVINGKALKSMNQYYNKKLSVLKSFVGNKSSNRIRKLTFKRNQKVLDYIHKTTRFIINYCIKNKISTIVVGKNIAWKQEINLGSKNNQNFVSIPFDTLIKQLEYKSEEVGIKVVVQEESYSSKCSFLDSEELCHHEKYLGRRIKRGLFKSANSILINADVNGAYNILRKAVPNAFANGIEGVGLHPEIVKVIQ